MNKMTCIVPFFLKLLRKNINLAQSPYTSFFVFEFSFTLIYPTSQNSSPSYEFFVKTPKNECRRVPAFNKPKTVSMKKFVDSAQGALILKNVTT